MSNRPASEANQLSLNYFQEPKGYFWRWTENGEVVEWSMGATICYREELQAVLDVLTPTALPPLGAVLLLLAACSGWNNAQEERLMSFFQQHYAAGMQEASLTVRALEAADALLQQVATLPETLRTGPAKLHLATTVFSEPASRSLPADRGLLVMAEWTSGRLDQALRQPAPPAQWSTYTFDLRALAKAAERFAAPGSLETHLRTGLPQPPAALPEPVLPPAPPEPAADLLTQLSQDARTYGLARLTQRLVAALHIPRHTREVSEQPLGGVADISNRGSFDRLLLSELAHDDLTLLARLAGNEAMYLRREAPPTPDVRPRLILLDTTLRLWGEPRVFGLAAALAWARLAQPARQPVPVRAYALGGQQAEPLDLATFEGVTTALARLDAAPHCGPVLQQVLARPEAAGADALLITAAELLHQPAFAAALAAAAPALRFLLTVDRGGELQLHERLRGGGRVLLGTSRHDLDELLFAPMPNRPPAPRPARPGEPAFLAQQPAPLLLPTAGLKVSPKTTFFHPELGLLGVTGQYRVLHCPRREEGARELLGSIEVGQNYFGFDEPATVYVLVHTGPGLVFYAFATDTGQVERVELAEEALLTKPLTQVTYLQGCFYLRFGDGQRVPVSVTVFDCRRRQVVVRHGGPFPQPERPGYYIDRGPLKQLINNGYSTLQNLSRLRLTPDAELALDGRFLHIWQPSGADAPQLRLHLINPDAILTHAAVPGPAAQLLDNPQLHLRPFRWPDGSLAWVDSRGLLHLRSANPGLPEVTVVLIVDQPTAAWAADGSVCGADYFTGPNHPHRLSAAKFYEQYLQPFINQLLK